MAGYCLPKYLVNDFLQRIKSGEINPEKLSQMSSAERRQFFTDILGEENSVNVNRLFESKLLLKNQQRGMVTWAEQIAGLRPEAKKDILSRINNMSEVLTPQTEQAFLEDLVAHKLGTAVTMNEAADIANLAKTANDAKIKMESSKRRGYGEPATEAEMEYGRARVDFQTRMDELKADAQRITPEELKARPLSTLKKGFVRGAGIAKSLKATLDNSALLRQGLPTLLTHPTVWYKNSVQSFMDIANVMRGKDVMREVQAEIISRPSYEAMLKDKVAVGAVEEAYPDSQLLEKIPYLGRLYKASETAFTAFQHRTRADLYDLYTQIAKDSGIEETAGIGIGKLVNTLTGRGDLGKLERAASAINNVFFSPRLLKSHLDILTDPLKGGQNPFIRKQASINLAKMVVGVSSVLAVANAIRPGSVETDPRSADFGKIRVGDTRFDVSGGIASLLTLGARMFTGYTKSSTTGKVTNLYSGKYGQPTVWDVLINYGTNKLSPVAGTFKDVLQGRTFQGTKPTIGSELTNLLVPLPITNAIELMQNPNSANVLLGTISDGLGISTNTYSLQYGANRQKTIQTLGLQNSKEIANITIQKAKVDELRDLVENGDAKAEDYKKEEKKLKNMQLLSHDWKALTTKEKQQEKTKKKENKRVLNGK